MHRYYTWNEFDESVDYIANQCKYFEMSGVYGVPRGGLCLAVALSHKLNIKLVEKPLNYSLIVDDVYETGTSLSNYKDIEGANYFVLVSKKEPTWWNTVNTSLKKEWIVFPWENKENIIKEQEEFNKSRGLI